MDLNVLCNGMKSMTQAERAEALATVEDDPDLPPLVTMIFRNLCELTDAPCAPESQQGGGFGQVAA